MLEHVGTSCVLLNNSVSLLGHQLVLHSFEHLGLGLRLEPEVSIGLFFVESLLHLGEILGTVELRVPEICFLLKFLSCTREELGFKLSFVKGQVLVSLPLVGVTSLVRSSTVETHVDVALDGLLEGLTLDDLVVAVLRDLVQYSLK